MNCADAAQPGVAPIRDYLKSLPYPAFRNGDCQPHAYYLVNNYNPGYLGTGQPAPLGPDKFTVPPTRQPNLGLLLSRHHISWHYYGEGWAGGQETGENSSYCNICNPFQYQTSIMANETVREQVMKDTTDLYTDLQAGTLPAVSFVKPSSLNDGHPGSSKFSIFEAFTRKILVELRKHPKLWQSTAVFVTTDEAGGYWDSGYIQPIDFFGDGPRIMLLVVSPYTRGGHVSHEYADHTSILKFIEANWGLPTISGRSRDNLPNPVQDGANPYVPTNSPALGDLMSMFHF
ncbi:MAG: hypothetical protein B7Z80_09585 [Rhodospirillales bacterium 20-64-7]|nr:MAG: hypothetical protein B7Z80_09585 [Rhodospirillales bacterium 20-64-7]